MNIYIVPNYTKPRTKEALGRVKKILRESGCPFTVDESAGREMPSGEKFDLLISLGGDGSLLRSGTLAAAAGVPVLPVNTGSAGYLTQVNLGNLEEALPAVLKEEPFQNCLSCPVLTVRVKGRKETIVINEISVMTPVVLAEFRIKRGQKVIYETAASGLIVCTGIGSTGINRSGGGKVFGRDEERYGVTPICPLSGRIETVFLAGEGSYSLWCSKDMMMSLDGNPVFTVPAGEETFFQPYVRKLLLKRIPH
jgi:NAD+ kinase